MKTSVYTSLKQPAASQAVLAATPSESAWIRLRRKRLAMACLALLIGFSALALYGEVIYRAYRWMDRTPPYQQVCLEQQYAPPGTAHPLGTDGLGRDVLQRLIQGARISFQVGVVTSLIAIPIGVILGCLAGYFGGRVDDCVVWLYSTFASIPSLLLILVISLLVGRGLPGVFLGIGLTTWVSVCRLLRGEVLKHKQQPYVEAARALGYSSLRILFRHILPNVAHVIIVLFTLRFPAAIGTEIFMSFLGIGVENEPSWGLMINSARLRLWQGAWWEMTFVTCAIFLVVLAFNLLGDALRDALDPRLHAENI